MKSCWEWSKARIRRWKENSTRKFSLLLCRDKKKETRHVEEEEGEVVPHSELVSPWGRLSHLLTPPTLPVCSCHTGTPARSRWSLRTCGAAGLPSLWLAAWSRSCGAVLLCSCPTAPPTGAELCQRKMWYLKCVFLFLKAAYGALTCYILL